MDGGRRSDSCCSARSSLRYQPVVVGTVRALQLTEKRRLELVKFLLKTG